MISRSANLSTKSPQKPEKFPPDFPKNHIYFDYGPTNAYGTTVSGSGSSSSASVDTAVSASPTGLTLGATYHYRVRLTEIGTGTSYAGADMVFTTGTPQIAVETDGGLPLVDAVGRLELGSVAPGATVTRTFTIRNTGTGTLAALNVTRNGSGAADYALTAPGTVHLPPGATTQFSVSFTPSAHGSRFTALHITSTDPLQSPFDINLTGTGNHSPTFSGYTATTKAGQPLELPLAKILARAGDPDGDTVGLTGAASPSAQGGVVELGAKLAYMPPEGFAGTDTIAVTLTDAFGAAATGTLTITVTGQAAANVTLGHNLSQITPRDGQIDLVFRGIPGRRYTIQRTADMAAWEDLATVVAGADGKILFTDPTPLQPQGFYRTRSATP